MSQTKLQTWPQPSLEGPRIEKRGSFLIAGLRRHYTDDRISNIPAQSQQFVAYLGKIPGQIGHTTFGACLSPANGAAGIDYLNGVEVSSAAGLAAEFSVVTVPAQDYAVFVHRGHVLQLRDSLEAIWQEQLPESGLQVSAASADSPVFFERYAERFDPRTSTGDVEIWIPIKLQESTN
jgi:AraC family transcriptional regulator